MKPSIAVVGAAAVLACVHLADVSRPCSTQADQQTPLHLLTAEVLNSFRVLLCLSRLYRNVASTRVWQFSQGRDAGIAVDSQALYQRSEELDARGIGQDTTESLRAFYNKFKGLFTKAPSRKDSVSKASEYTSRPTSNCS